MLLIITNEADIHPNPVARKLNERGIPFFRLNTDRLLADYDVTCTLSSSGYYFEIKYKLYPMSINSDQISCVWERRPVEPLATYDQIDDEQIRKMELDEADGFLRFLRYALTGMDIMWIGHPINERRGGSKILQKMIARELGFNIPLTVFSNVLNSIDVFLDKEVAVKPVCSFGIPANDGDIIFYTQKVRLSQLLELGEASFRNTINFLEEYKEKQYELRITVIGKFFFAAKVCSQEMKEDTGAIDWRQGYEHGIKFVATEMPEELKDGCLKFLAYFGLSFGCFDFILDKEGNYIFLECNTNGQWMWLEEEAGLPISDALVQYFLAADERHSKSRQET